MFNFRNAKFAGERSASSGLGAGMRLLSITKALGLGLALTLISSNGLRGNSDYTVSDSEMRQPSSLPFPRHRGTKDVDDILSDYPDYLRFVMEIGKDVDPATTQKLGATYTSLRKRDPKGAARFLRGLRFEMVQKLEFLGTSHASVTTSTPVVRQWVRRYLKEWHREADEYLFRSIAFRNRGE